MGHQHQGTAPLSALTKVRAGRQPFQVPERLAGRPHARRLRIYRGGLLRPIRYRLIKNGLSADAWLAAIAVSRGLELGSWYLARSSHRLTQQHGGISDRYREGCSHTAWQATGCSANSRTNVRCTKGRTHSLDPESVVVPLLCGSLFLACRRYWVVVAHMPMHGKSVPTPFARIACAPAVLAGKQPYL
jgi:hypothetical protein